MITAARFADADIILARARAVLNDRGYGNASEAASARDADATVAAARISVGRTSKSREAGRQQPSKPAVAAVPVPPQDDSLQAKIARAEALAAARQRERIAEARSARLRARGGGGGNGTGPKMSAPRGPKAAALEEFSADLENAVVPEATEVRVCGFVCSRRERAVARDVRHLPQTHALPSAESMEARARGALADAIQAAVDAQTGSMCARRALAMDSV